MTHEGSSAEVASRRDLEAIATLIPSKARVLDLGCGDGLLLASLIQRKQIVARGVEIDEINVRACIARGLSVRHGNIEEGLADYRDNAFDYVTLSKTLAYLDHPEPVVREMLRVGKYAVISFENSGYWQYRWRAVRGQGAGYDLCSGEPRMRAITLHQFGEFCKCTDSHIERVIFLTGTRNILRLPSIRSADAVYVLTH